MEEAAARAQAPAGAGCSCGRGFASPLSQAACATDGKEEAVPGGEQHRREGGESSNAWRSSRESSRCRAEFTKVEKKNRKEKK
nr:unnamed protein product [Digitaria exilis]